MAESFLQTVLHEKLERALGKKLYLKINDNRSTMLSVQWGYHSTRLSLHRFFLKAPENILQDLIWYVKRRSSRMSTGVKLFIEKKLRSLDYSDQVALQDLEVQGKVHDLGRYFQELNQKYFENRVKNVRVTWYGKRKNVFTKSLILGQYQHLLKLIRVHRLLDQPKVPTYVVSFVLFHEMLHHFCLPRCNLKGITKVHGTAFKKNEKLFEDYAEAKMWLKSRQFS